MNISLAEVTNRFDPKRNHGFFAKIEGLGWKEKFILGTSPYMGGAQGGFVGHVPGKGVSILVVQTGEGGSWYYLSSTFKKESQMTDGAVNETAAQVPPAQRVVDVAGESGAGDGVPHILAYQDELGNGIKFVHQKRPGAMNVKAEMATGGGKRISLVDSTKIDSITLDTGSKKGTNKLEMTGPDALDIDAAIVPNMFQLQTTGPQKFINTKSQTDVVVGVGGRELQLLNCAGVVPGSTSSVDWSPLKSGNVNIQSRGADVNVFSLADEGSIFIECLDPVGKNNGQVIEIQTHGTNGHITIKTNGTVGIEAGGNIALESLEGDINIKADQKINIEAGGDLSLKSTGGTAYVNGAPNIRLNEDGSTNANPIVVDNTNVYGDKGITTY